MSMNAHYNTQLYPRDDLESLCYSLSAMIRRRDLPWAENNNHTYQDILRMKKSTLSEVGKI